MTLKTKENITNLKCVFGARAALLKKAINDAGIDCVYRAQAQAVLDYVNYLAKCSLKPPITTLNEVLDMTITLIDPKTPREEVEKLLPVYDQYARKLKSTGSLKILGGIMCLLAAVVCIALVVGAIIFLAHLGNAAILKAGPELLLGLIFGMEISSGLGGFSIVQSIKYITSGVRSRILGNSLQGLLSEVSKGQTNFEVGMKYLKAGENKLALSYLSKVPENSPNYQKAQVMIASNTFAPSKESSKPQDFSNLMRQVKALEGKEEEGVALPDVKMEAIDWSPVSIAV